MSAYLSVTNEAMSGVGQAPATCPLQELREADITCCCRNSPLRRLEPTTQPNAGGSGWVARGRRPQRDRVLKKAGKDQLGLEKAQA